MSNYSALKTLINAYIKKNGSQAITGQILNSVLNSMVDSLGKGYQFAGIATPTGNPGTIDQKVFYLAVESGTYTNYGGLEVSGTSLLVYDSAWSVVALCGDDIARTADLDAEAERAKEAEPYKVEYGVTPYADILEAVNAGKYVYMVYNGNTYVYERKTTILLSTGKAISFVAVNSDTTYQGTESQYLLHVCVTAADKWKAFDGVKLATDDALTEENTRAKEAETANAEAITAETERATKAEPYYAKYGTATFEDVMTALNAGREVWTIYKSYLYTLTADNNGMQFVFTSVTYVSSSIYVSPLYLTSTGGWTAGTMTKLATSSDLSSYVKTTTLATELAKKNPTLVAGDNVTITDNEDGTQTIASTGGGGSSSVAWGKITGTLSEQTDLNDALANKQDKLTDKDKQAIADLHTDAFDDDYKDKVDTLWEDYQEALNLM